MTQPTRCPKCGHDLAEPLAPRDLFGYGEAAVAVAREVTTARWFEEDFWPAYPRKVGKKAALAAFKRLELKASDFVLLMAALAVQKASDQWNRQGVQYVPHPATWLNQRRWEDDPQAYGRAGTAGQPGRVGLAPGQKLSHDDTHLTESEDVGEG